MIVALDSSSAESAVSGISPASQMLRVLTDDGVCVQNCLRDNLGAVVVPDDTFYAGVNGDDLVGSLLGTGEGRDFVFWMELLDEE